MLVLSLNNLSAFTMLLDHSSAEFELWNISYRSSSCGPASTRTRTTCCTCSTWTAGRATGSPARGSRTSTPSTSRPSGPGGTRPPPQEPPHPRPRPPGGSLGEAQLGPRRRQAGPHQAGAVMATRAACLAVAKDLDRVRNREIRRELASDFFWGILDYNSYS